ncbi:MAG: TonB-dependent receptor [Pseudomonadota bacterium]
MTALSRLSLPTRHRLRVLALAAGALAGAPLAALAAHQDLTTVPLEQLLAMEVYSASKFVQQSSQAPSSVTVITAADIRDFGWRTLADVARSVRGLYASYDRNYSYLGERGFLRPGDYNTRFLLLVDGNRVNDAVYDQAPLGAEFPLDLELVERIEFVPGPGSSIYGSNAFFGVINVITRKGADLAGSRVQLELGQDGVRNVGARTGWRSAGGAEFVLAASRHRRAGRDLYYPEFDTPEQNHGLAQGLDYERGERFLASAAHAGLSLTLMHARRVKGVPTASFAQPFNDPRSQTTDRQTYLNAAWSGRTASGDEVSARLFTGRYDSYGDYINDDAQRSLNHDGSAARWWGAELSVLVTRWKGHTLLAGFDYQRDHQLRQYNFDVVPYFSYLNTDHHGSRAGLFIQDEIALGSDTLLNLGLRYDRNSGIQGVFSPRVALIHAFTPNTTLKAILGSAYRAPNSYERFYAFPGEGGQLANPDLAKETIRSAELVLVQQLDSRRRLTATVFRNVVDGLITQRQFPGQPETRFDNAQRTRAHGVEVEYEQSWQAGARLRAGYSYAHAGGGEQQLNAPARLAKLNLAAPLGYQAWRGGFELQYVGPRRAITGIVPGFWLANANLVNARLTHNLDAAIGIYNLFDRRYADPGSAEHLQTSIAQDGRRLQARIGYAF